MKSVRLQERSIQKIVVDKVKMPKEQFQKVFIGHENKDTWLVKALSSGKTWSEKLAKHEEEIRYYIDNILEIERQTNLTVSQIREVQNGFLPANSKHAVRKRNGGSQLTSCDFYR